MGSSSEKGLSPDTSDKVEVTPAATTNQPSYSKAVKQDTIVTEKKEVEMDRGIIDDEVEWIPAPPSTLSAIPPRFLSIDKHLKDASNYRVWKTAICKAVMLECAESKIR